MGSTTYLRTHTVRPRVLRKLWLFPVQNLHYAKFWHTWTIMNLLYHGLWCSIDLGRTKCDGFPAQGDKDPSDKLFKSCHWQVTMWITYLSWRSNKEKCYTWTCKLSLHWLMYCYHQTFKKKSSFKTLCDWLETCTSGGLITCIYIYVFCKRASWRTNILCHFPSLVHYPCEVWTVTCNLKEGQMICCRFQRRSK